jgi:diguanylate cyclase (GGDEF)-like protein/PAS domain S-box-containing protein
MSQAAATAGLPRRALSRARRSLPAGHTLPDDAWRRRHRVLVGLLWLHAAGIPVYAMLLGYSLPHGLLDATPIAVFAGMGGLIHGRKAGTTLVSLGLLTASAVIVHLSKGLIEAHFHFFVVVVLLTIYEDWLPFLVAVAYVLVHHGVGGSIAPGSVYDHAGAEKDPWEWAAIHAGFVGAAGLAAVAAWRLNEDVRQRLRGLVDSSGDAILEVDTEGRITAWNSAAQAMLGYAPEAIEGRPLSTLACSDGDNDLDRLVRDALAGETVDRHETVCATADGRPVDVSLTVSPVLGAGATVGASIVARDIGERRALQEAEVRYRKLVERVPAITYVAESGANGTWHYVSPQIQALLGYSPEEWQADRGLWYSRLHPDDRDRVMAEEERFEASREPLGIEYRLLARDGRTVWVRDHAVFRPLGGRDARYMDGLLTDVTERRILEEQLRHLATHDHITGLYNRHRFEEELRHQVAYARRYGTSAALLVLDLDCFKSVNDTAGHHAGDFLLKGVAEALRGRLRAVDVLGRLGGDEFAVFLPEVDEEDARRVAEDLVGRIRQERVAVADRAVETTASVGIAMLAPDVGLDAERLLMQADTAMYEAKYDGGDGLAFFAPETTAPTGG